MKNEEMIEKMIGADKDVWVAVTTVHPIFILSTFTILSKYYVPTGAKQNNFGIELSTGPLLV